MILDTVFLSRVQFGFTIGFHILFPTLNIGLALFLTIMEACWLKTRHPDYLAICKFWSSIFALTFGMGVVSGIVLSYELGTNFGPFTHAIGSVLGPLFGYEVLSAFFLEAGFLGIMILGWNRVSPRMHFTATLMVMLGTLLSAFWIMSANSWMQFPAGTHFSIDKFVVDSWWEAIMNPLFLPRFLHMVMASFVTSTFFIAGVSAWYLFKKQHEAIAKRCFSYAMSAALVLVPLQIFVGDVVGLNVHEYQPLKTAAMEGLWETTKGAPLVLFAIPNLQLEKNDYEISIPYVASLINTHHLDGELVGLKSVSADKRPLVTNVFFSFRIMLAIGFFMLAMSFYGLWLKFRKRLYTARIFQFLCILTTPLGFISTIAGWLTAESGRQPWAVYQYMTTAQGASQIPMNQVVISLTLFIFAYGFVFSFYLYYLFKLIRRGPVKTEEVVPPFQYMPSQEIH